MGGGISVYKQTDKNNNKLVIGTRFILCEQVYLTYNNSKYKTIHSISAVQKSRSQWCS